MESPFQWAIQWLSNITWPVILLVAIRLTYKISKAVRKPLDQIDAMSTNCLPTIQKELIEQSVALRSIDTNIARIADRG